MTQANRASHLTRRDFLRYAGLAAAGGALAGCAVPAAAPAGEPGAAADAAPSTAVEEVYAMTYTAFADMGQREATEILNEQVSGSGVQYVLEEVAEGWEPKAVSMVRDDEMYWSANGIANAGLQWNYIQMGIVQPLDDLLASSEIPWAENMQEQYIAPNIYEATQFDGQTYYVPMKLNIHLMGYRQDYLERAGYDAIPETWAEFEGLLEALKTTLADEQVVPFGARKEMFRTLGTAFTTFVENPYDENNMLRIDSEEFLACIRMFKDWFDAGYTNLEVLQDPVADWQIGKVAIGIDSHSWIRIGRSIWGTENVQGTVPPKVNPEDPPRTWAHLDSAFVFNNAPNPRAGLDWLLNVHGPEGAPADRYWSGTLSFSGMPVHQNQYDRLIGTGEYPELVKGYEALPNSVLQPLEAGRFYPIIQAKIWPWLERYWGNEVSAEVAIENTLAEIQEELDNLVS
ncbi:MAG: twin-arginine translocation signal domain-containing protein [Litorilinea sp.]